MFENFSKLVNERQACRNYIDKKVEQEKLDKIAKKGYEKENFIQAILCCIVERRVSSV